MLKISILGFLMHELTLKANLKKKGDQSPESVELSSDLANTNFSDNSVANQVFIQANKAEFSISF